MCAEVDADAQPRPAVVTVMGHVDHGKVPTASFALLLAVLLLQHPLPCNALSAPGKKAKSVAPCAMHWQQCLTCFADIFARRAAQDFSGCWRSWGYHSGLNPLLQVICPFPFAAFAFIHAPDQYAHGMLKQPVWQDRNWATYTLAPMIQFVSNHYQPSLSPSPKLVPDQRARSVMTCGCVQ